MEGRTQAMAQVEIRINNRPYRISCDDGQEEHLTRLADFVDKRVQELVASVGQVGEDRLLVMASLLIADELSETFAQIDTTAQPDTAESDDEAEARRVQVIEALTDRIERVATRLKPA
jgi:cell division protein ZapA